ncbi:hypothetical protein HMPREF9069_01096 [Atopobium sp. oral taxon 810 str. F0209]|nr:hypothetical protein HMPREF9069_01096 [Atopobium sp. oral taxon 810 str. F0209]
MLFRRVINNFVDDSVPIIELFYDGSIKIRMPIAMWQGGEHEHTLFYLVSLKSIRNTELVRVIDGLTFAGIVMQSCQVVDTYLDKIGRKASDYAITTEFESIQGIMIEFSHSGVR